MIDIFWNNVQTIIYFLTFSEISLSSSEDRFGYFP